ncbi:hypothetical protein A7X93_00405 [Stenotrophomonas maltophilia]|uniref:hypothetical protein n=1 Tax=Stenotrophomonas maltophilia TaxID=40324 RepID=UPI000DA73D4A|nr:hypothetical protein [Stenotrophomonas maltophilia]PZT35103.1 hypothetical protein A7X93_00405 [Stenotrophomonas maltophilia]
MNRTFGDWEVWSAVESDGGPEYRTAIWVKHQERGIQRVHYMQGFRHTQAVEATAFIEETLLCITGVNDDGTLRIR